MRQGFFAFAILLALVACVIWAFTVPPETMGGFATRCLGAWLLSAFAGFKLSDWYGPSGPPGVAILWIAAQLIILVCAMVLVLAGILPPGAVHATALIVSIVANGTLFL